MRLERRLEMDLVVLVDGRMDMDNWMDNRKLERVEKEKKGPRLRHSAIKLLFLGCQWMDQS